MHLLLHPASLLWQTCREIVRFLTDHMAELPLAVTARLLETYDVLMVLAPLLEAKPWQSESGGKLHWPLQKPNGRSTLSWTVKFVYRARQSVS